MLYEFKKMNDSQKQNILNNLIHNKGFSKSDIVEISDFENVKLVLIECQRLKVKTKLSKEQKQNIINSHINNLKNNQELVDQIRDELYSGELSKHDCSEKYLIPLSTMSEIFNTVIDNYKEIIIRGSNVRNAYKSHAKKKINKIESKNKTNLTYEELVNLSNYMSNRGLSYNDIEILKNIKKENLISDFKKHYLTIKRIGKDNIINNIYNEIIKDSNLDTKLNELKNNIINYDEFAHYYQFNKHTAKTILKLILNNDYDEFIKYKHANAITKYSQQRKNNENENINENIDDINNLIEDLSHFYGSKSSIRPQKDKFDLLLENINNDEELSILFKNIDSNFNNSILSDKKLINNYISNNQLINKLYLTYKNLFNKIDSYPNGKLMTNLSLKLPINEAIEIMKNNNLIINNDELRASFCELKIIDILNKYNINYIYRDRKSLLNTSQSGQEIDLFLIDYNLGLEINPSYTHNSNKFRLNHFNKSKQNTYHFNKYKAASEKNIKLIQLYDWDLTDDALNHHFIPQLLNYTNIAPFEKIDNYLIEQVDRKNINQVQEMRDFLALYSPSIKNQSKFEYLFKCPNTNEVWAVATFSMVHNKNKNWIELKRFCVKSNLYLNNALDLLFNKVLNDHLNYEAIFCYSNIDNFEDSYQNQSKKLKFISETGASLKFVSTTDPTDVYSRHISMKHGARSGVIADDLAKKGLPTFNEQPFNILEYIETNLSHRTDDGEGYDAIYTSGSKLWLAERSNFI